MLDACQAVGNFFLQFAGPFLHGPSAFLGFLGGFTSPLRRFEFSLELVVNPAAVHGAHGGHARLGLAEFQQQRKAV